MHTKIPIVFLDISIPPHFLVMRAIYILPNTETNKVLSKNMSL